MKKIVLILLLPLLSIGQTQIGNDIDGEYDYDNSGGNISMSSDGNTIAIGARYNDGNGSNAGQIRVFHNTSGVWTQIGSDIDGEKEYDYVGASFTLSSDGKLLIVAGKTDLGPSFIRMYRNISGVWTKIVHNLKFTNIYPASPNLSEDGTTLSLNIASNYNGINSGSVRVYKDISGTWTQVGTDIYGEAAEDRSGSGVSLSSDGNIIAIGAYRNDGYKTNAGHVRVYKNISGVWTQIGADIDGYKMNGNFGFCTALSSDGNTIAIGAPGIDQDLLSIGYVQVFHNNSGVWTQVGSTLSDLVLRSYVGWSVALSSDGLTLAISNDVNDDGGEDAGQVKVYHNTSGVWKQIGSNINGKAVNDLLGQTIVMSSDGTKLAISATGNDGNGASRGQVRVYDLSPVLPTLSSDSFVLANFSVCPNPASEVVTVSLQEGLKLEKVNVYNTLGQLVKTEIKDVIAVNSLAKGSYYFEVITNKGKATKTILVK